MTLHVLRHAGAPDRLLLSGGRKLFFRARFPQGRAMDVAAELERLMLKAPRLTLAVAESLTAGKVQAEVAAVSGASAYFLGGITAYSIAQKTKLLGVDRATANKVNGVSAAVALQMARGVCALFGAEVGVATTGYAEANKARGVAEPMAWWALVHVRRGRIWAQRSGRVECPGETRIDTQAMVASAVLVELADYLRELRRRDPRGSPGRKPTLGRFGKIQ